MVIFFSLNRVRISLFAAPVLFCWLSIGTRVEAQDNSPPQKVPDKTAEIKTLQIERQVALRAAVRIAVEEYQTGRLDITRVVQAEKDLLRATVELGDAPEKRLAALKDARDSAKALWQIAKAKFDLGRSTEFDSLLARAALLDATIELLREELKTQPGK